MLSLLSGKYILFDGAFGTYYSMQNGDSAPCELACINSGDAVLAIHKSYIAAGATAIKTNTFAANTLSLGVDFSVVASIIRAACRLAFTAAEGTAAEVVADIGPIPSDENGEYFRIIDCFLEEGADNFLFETMSSPMVFELADYVKSKAKSFTIVSFAAGQDGYTAKGISAEEIFSAAESSAVDALGFNCAPPSELLKLFKGHFTAVKMLSASPNASYPSGVGGRTIFQDNARYFADKLLEIYGCGVKILGGCCGTTPLHIRELSRRLSEGQVPVQAPSDKAAEERRENASIAGTAGGKLPIKNTFAEKLRAGKRVIAVELDPPLDTDFSHIRAAVPALKAAGADAITIADNPLARARADSVIISAKVQREGAIAVIPHISCRDRNAIGIKSALLGASIEAVQNLLIVTGDPVPSADRSGISGVFSMNSFGLIKYADSLNRDIFAEREFFLGGALNINAVNFEGELARAVKKQGNGADFFLTQPIYDKRALGNLSKARKALTAKLLAGIMPIVSYKNAVFLNNEVVGIEVPAALIAEIKDKSPKEVLAISLAFSLDIAQQAAENCDGFYLMTPLKRYDMIVKLINLLNENYK